MVDSSVGAVEVVDFIVETRGVVVSVAVFEIVVVSA